MKGLLVVAGLATAVAAVSGILLVSAPRGPGGESGPGAAPGAAGAGAPVSPAAAAAAAERDMEMERRLRALELRIEEIQGQFLMAGPGGWDGSGGKDFGGGGPGRRYEAPRGSALPGEPGEDAEGGGGDGDGDGDGAEASALAVREEALRALADARGKAGEIRRERDLVVRLDMMAVSMDLQPAEKDRMEEILRAHVAKVEESGARAKELLRDSKFGLTPADRAALDQSERDRRELDRATEQSILGLVGADRWKRFRASMKDQADKERTLRRLGQPW